MRRTKGEYVFEPSRTNSRIQKPMAEYCQTWELVFTARATGQVLTYASEGSLEHLGLLESLRAQFIALRGTCIAPSRQSGNIFVYLYPRASTPQL